MTQDLFQEVTGVKLQSEKKEYVTAKEISALGTPFLEMPTYHNITREDSVWEFYFVPEELNSNIQGNEEEYLVSITTEKDDSCITLKKRYQMGDLMNEKASRISKSQFKELLLENYEWMKRSGELLLLELYNKFKLWKMKIGILMECARRQAYFASERLLITIDQYRVFPSNQYVALKSPVYQQMQASTHRITVRDFGSNYAGMGCRDIIRSLASL